MGIPFLIFLLDFFCLLHSCNPFLESPLGLEKIFYLFSLLLKRIWNEAEYLFMQSIVQSELNDVMNAGEEPLIVMCISRYSLVKV
jgi:hypothetical protein